MAKARKRNQRTAPGWTGFRSRLRMAVDQRRDEGASQNAIADSAGIDSGQLTKILSGERSRGVAANTVLLLAEALRVRPMWLLTGEEPSGLVEPRKERLESSVPPPMPGHESTHRRTGA